MKVPKIGTPLGSDFHGDAVCRDPGRFYLMSQFLDAILSHATPEA